MAERTIRIKFDGSAKGLERAANKAARQLDRFGDQAEDAFGRAGAAGGESFLDNFTKKLDNAVDVAASLGSGIVRAFQSNPFIASAIAAALLGTLLVAMPAVGAAAGAALVGAFGAGIAGIGLAALAQTDRVQAAFDDLVSDVTSTLARLAAPLEGVIARAMSGLRGLVDFFAPALEQAFASMAPHLDRFIGNAIAAMQQLRPAIQPVTEAFNSILDAVGGVLPGLMEAFAGVIADIARIIKNNSGAFADLVKLFGGIALVALEVVRGLTQAWVAFTDIVDVSMLFAAISPTTALALSKIDTKSEGLAGAQSKAGRSIRNATKALQKQVEQIRMATDPVFRLTTSIRRVEDAQKAYNDAVDKYGPESQQARDASIALAQAVARAEQAANNGDLSFSAFKRKLDQWVRQGVITEGQADAIAARVREARRAADDFSGSYTATLNLIDNVSASLNRIGTRLNSIGDYYASVVSGGRASGGPVAAGQTYLVGEKGPELITMGSSSGYVTPNHELGGAGGMTVNGPLIGELKAYSDRFSLRQVLQQAAIRGAM